LVSETLPTTLKPLISRHFEPFGLRLSDYAFCNAATDTRCLVSKRFHWRTFPIPVVYQPGRKFVRFKKESLMAWKAPKIVEVPVGMEINMYACAARK
jgi:coenzyme PQQ precursor peptide PqqA